MLVTSAAGEKKWVSISWLPVLNVSSPRGLLDGLTAIEAALVELWRANTWVSGQQDSSGLFFPVDGASLRRVQTEPGNVHVGYAVCDGQLAGGIVLHKGSAIGPYAANTVAWAKSTLGASEVAFVRSLCVSKSLRGFGIGREMLRAARKLARHLEAPIVVGHLRVSPELDERHQRAYSDAGFSVLGDAVTTTLYQEGDLKWADIGGRETPADPAHLSALETVEFSYRPVGAPAAKHRIGVAGQVERRASQLAASA